MAKRTIYSTKRHHGEWGGTLVSSLSDRGFISRIYGEKKNLSASIQKKEKNPIKNSLKI